METFKGTLRVCRGGPFQPKSKPISNHELKYSHVFNRRVGEDVFYV